MGNLNRSRLSQLLCVAAPSSATRVFNDKHVHHSSSCLAAKKAFFPFRACKGCPGRFVQLLSALDFLQLKHRHTHRHTHSHTDTHHKTHHKTQTKEATNRLLPPYNATPQRVGRTHYTQQPCQELMPTLEYPTHVRHTLKNSSPTPQAPQHAVSNLTGRGAVDAGGRENRVAGNGKECVTRGKESVAEGPQTATCIPPPHATLSPQGHAPIHGLGRDF